MSVLRTFLVGNNETKPDCEAQVYRNGPIHARLQPFTQA